MYKLTGVNRVQKVLEAANIKLASVGAYSCSQELFDIRGGTQPDRLEAIHIFCHSLLIAHMALTMELLPLPIEDRLLTVTKLSARALL